MAKKIKALVYVIMGSKSDLATMKPCFNVLKTMNIPFTAHVLSAHRTPEDVRELTTEAHEKGVKVIIAAAGGAAHLAGAVAAHTVLPVIGIPMPSVLNGLDSLLSTVQMPKGMPVLTVAIGKAGSENAGLAAAQIIALSDDNVLDRFVRDRATRQRYVLEDCDEINLDYSSHGLYENN
jgi:phosphoribosylaminoimidazole carboxylase PurE protein